MAHRKGAIHNVMDDRHIGSDYIQLFNNLNWKKKFTENDFIEDQDPHRLLIKAIDNQTNDQHELEMQINSLVS